MTFQCYPPERNHRFHAYEREVLDHDVGYDFALSPEIIGFLAEQRLASHCQGGFLRHDDLDEHELAIG